MSEGEKTKPVDRRGTFWDWPVPVMIVGALLLFYAAAKAATAGMLIALFVVTFGAVTLLARRGSFRPRD
jgi:hypothetical protein